MELIENNEKRFQFQGEPIHDPQAHYIFIEPSQSFDP